MARTIKEIADAIKAEFVANSTLRDMYQLGASKSFDEQFSKVSLEAILIYVFASSLWLHETIWDSFSTSIEKKIESSYVTSIAWYYQKALEFQKGDALVFDKNTCSFGYSVIDESKQIVKNVAIREVEDDGVTKLKIYFSSESKRPLTGDLYNSFCQYIREIGAAGIHYLFVSQDPDMLRVHMNIYYDALVMDSSGCKLSDGTKPVEEAIRQYINSIEYGGVLYASKLVDAVQAANGVKDVTLEGTTWKGTKENRRRIDSESGAFRYVIADGDLTYLID